MEHRTEVRYTGSGNFHEVGIIVYKGQEFKASGAAVTDTHASVYITTDTRTGNVTTFNGDVIGTYVETGKWKRYHPRTGYPWTIRTVQVRINGRTYVGRYGPDNSQVVHLRRVKGEINNG